MFDAILGSIENFNSSKKKSDLKKFLVYGNKFHLLIELVYVSLVADPDDIFYKPLDHKDWQLMFSHMEIYEPKNLKKFISDFKGVIDYLALGSSFLSKI